MDKGRALYVVCLLAGWLAASAALAAPPTVEPGSWTLAVVPDTQYYTRYDNGVFEAQTDFLADYKSALNLKYALHEGDIVQSNETASYWAIASNAMLNLEMGGVNYSLLPGNHDYYNNSETRSSQLSSYFPTTRLDNQSSYGGVYPGEPTLTNNSYSFFSTGSVDWLVIALEFGPRDGVVDWADSLMKQYPSRQVMLVTHSYLYPNTNPALPTGTLVDWATYGATQNGNPHDNDGDGTPDNQGISILPGGVNDGGEIWNALKDNPNLLFVFNGHHTTPGYSRPNDPGGASYLAGTADDGHTVHQLFANYQGMANDNGYLRLLEFQADGDVRVRTYSPNKDLYLTGPKHDFVLTIPTFIPGDANGDNQVDDADAQIVAEYWGEGSAYWQMGDFDKDGIVGPTDVAILAANWGYGVTSEATAAVPEPSLMVLVCAALGMFVLRRVAGR